ncbi:MAG: hypothetical protein KatS3mg105_3652 [Gemmatales bacterium]|nr:MAG: hypothetical protein KatS3mg105_3652 [Gemmatales bacterium]
MRFRLTKDFEKQVTDYVRAGGFDWVAAEAAGVPWSVYMRWLGRGRRRDARNPYRSFYLSVMQAKAQARLKAEIVCREERPLEWLRYGPGREDNRPGWTSAAKPTSENTLDHALVYDLAAIVQDMAEQVPAMQKRIDDFLHAFDPDW